MAVNPTIAEFQATLDIMRKEYHFTDNARISLMDYIICRGEPGRLTLVETNSETGTEVVMTREYVGHEYRNDKDATTCENK